MRPLDPLPSIKLKLGVVIVAAVCVTVGLIILCFRAHLAMWWSIPGSIVVGLGMVQLLARGMTSPLREMAAAATAMSKGEYGRRVRATSRDEVGRLAEAFNAMAAELAQVDRMRRDLVANVSHELRTPISALQAHLENIVDDVEPADPAALRIMLHQVERLGRLVTQLLDLSRLESGAVPLQVRPFDVRTVLEQAARESQLHAPDTPIEVGVDATVRPVVGDPERIHQVVANLVENAVRYSPPGGRVRISARPHNGARLAIEVSDGGPGIPTAERARVFERFYRADAARTSTDGGSGLGLAIARWIVDLHGGEIRAEDAEPSGCRMVVVLPTAGAGATLP
jgi:signal transduction histidine kinase